MTFTGFPRETLAFLEGINADNSKEWLSANRPLYDATIDAAKVFVESVGPELRSFAPNIQFAPKVGGSLQRPNRDTRVDTGKPPYKEQFDIWFWHGDKKGWDQPGFFLRIAPDNLWIASGMMHILWPQLKTFRAAVLDDRAGEALVATVATVDTINAIGPYQVGYPKRKTVPKGFDADHPRAEYLKYESLWGHLQLPAGAALSPQVALKAWRDLAPLSAWLLAEVTTQEP